MVSVFLGNYALFKESTYKERNVFADVKVIIFENEVTF